MKTLHTTLPRMTALAIGIALCSSPAVAGSFALTTQDVAARSQANAGIGVLGGGASAVYSNPALLAKQKGTQASGGVTFVMPSTEISNAASNLNGPPPGFVTVSDTTSTNNGDMVDNAVVPNLYLSHQADDHATIGLGLYSTHGFQADYEPTFAGREFADESEFTTVTLAPAMGFDITPRIQAGFSVNLSFGEGTLTSKPSKELDAISIPNIASLEGNDFSMGYTLGLHADVTDILKLGLVHRSKQKYDLQGDVLIKAATGLIPTPFTFTGPGSLVINTPASTELSIGAQATDALGVYATVTHTQWDVLQQVQVETAFPNLQPEQLKYKNSNTYAIGGDYQVNPMLKLRAGVAYDETPTEDAFRSLRLPTADRMLYALGANVALSTNTKLDIGYSFVQEDTAPINVSKPDPLPAPTTNTYKADFKNSAHLLMLQLSHTF